MTPMNPSTPPLQQHDRFMVSSKGAHSVLVFVFCLTAIPGCASLVGSRGGDLSCPDTVQATVSEARPQVRVSYTEPSLTIDEMALKNLSKTSIYYDLGKGRILAKDIPATQPTGGGQISETIAIPIRKKEEHSVKICVTATDQLGNESTMTP